MTIHTHLPYFIFLPIVNMLSISIVYLAYCQFPPLEVNSVGQ